MCHSWRKSGIDLRTLSIPQIEVGGQMKISILCLSSGTTVANYTSCGEVRYQWRRIVGRNINTAVYSVCR